jgi:hypothetical protein
LDLVFSQAYVAIPIGKRKNNTGRIIELGEIIELDHGFYRILLGLETGRKKDHRQNRQGHPYFH